MFFSFLQDTSDRHRVCYLSRPYFTISGHVTEAEMTAHIGFINLCTACASIGKEIFLFLILMIIIMKENQCKVYIIETQYEINGNLNY